MIEKEDLLALHDGLNRVFWGATGLRSAEALEAALARPLASFDGQELYPAVVDKAAALTESLVKNHPFQEGNMRTAFVVLRFLLLKEGLELGATEEEKHAFMLAIATATLNYEQIRQWIGEYSRPVASAGV